MYSTHLIYQALGKPRVETEPCAGHCAFCGDIITEGMKLKESVSDAFTNFDMLVDMNASHVCAACHACLKETKLRRMNFITTKNNIEYFKRDKIEHYLFNPPNSPFVFAITVSMKKHMSFKARVNYSSKLFYVQKEDEQILFSPMKYMDIFAAMKSLYKFHSKTAIGSGEYQQGFIKKQGLKEFIRDENIIKNERGSQQFELMLFAMNMSEENLKKMKERIAKKEQKENEKHGM